VVATTFGMGLPCRRFLHGWYADKMRYDGVHATKLVVAPLHLERVSCVAAFRTGGMQTRCDITGVCATKLVAAPLHLERVSHKATFRMGGMRTRCNMGGGRMQQKWVKRLGIVHFGGGAAPPTNNSGMG
jgi:hypothetical protein